MVEVVAYWTGYLSTLFSIWAGTFHAIGVTALWWAGVALLVIMAIKVWKTKRL